MTTLQRTLALIAVASVTGCGGGGSASQTPAAPAVTATSAAVTRTPNATAKITLKFPAHVAKARLANSTARNPKYINPHGGSLVFSYQGTIITDPSTGNPYFSLGIQDGTTGTSTITVPLASGQYTSGDLRVAEYDQTNGTGNGLAYGYNAQYTDANGNVQSGTFTVNPGDTLSPVITLVMNVAGIAVTTDPVAGSDAQLIGTSGYIDMCTSSAGPYYFFAADANATIVLPGTGAGFTGGDANTQVPGVPAVSLYNQTAINAPQADTLTQSILGPSVFLLNAPNGSGYVQAAFTVQNPVYNYNPPFTNAYAITGYLNIGPGMMSCGL